MIALIDKEDFYFFSSNFSEEAAQFYNDNKYEADEVCGNPCKTMDVVTNLKYRRKRENNDTNGYLKLYFPRRIIVKTEIMTKTFITAGIKPNKSRNVNDIFKKIFFSCRGWWISWNDSRCKLA